MIEPILFLHGAGSAGNAWSLNSSVLSKHYRCLTPDLPGCGEAPPPAEYWSVPRYAQWAAELLDSERIGSAYVVGNSFGAAIGLELATMAPERVLKLVLIGPPPMDPVGQQHATYELLRLVGEDGRPRFDTCEELRLITPFASEELRVLANFNLDRCRTYLHIMPALVTYPFAERKPLCDTWLVFGEDDRVVPPSSREHWARHLPSAIQWTVPEAGHCPQFDRPLEFNPRLKQFLRSHTGGGLIPDGRSL